MVASYTVEGDSFRADKPRLWSDKRVEPLGLDLHPDGDRFAVALAPEGQVQAKQDRVVFVFNFFDELRRLAPVTKRSANFERRPRRGSPVPVDPWGH